MLLGPEQGKGLWRVEVCGCMSMKSMQYNIEASDLFNLLKKPSPGYPNPCGYSLLSLPRFMQRSSSATNGAPRIMSLSLQRESTKNLRGMDLD